VLRRLALAIAVSVVVAACGDDPDAVPPTGGDARPRGETEVRLLTDTSREAVSADPKLAGRAITDFGVELFGRIAETAAAEDNVIVSPASVAIALAAVEPGVVGDAQQQLRALLGIEDAEAFHRSMNALQRSIEDRKPAPANDEGEKPGEITMRIANSLFLQHDYPVEKAYLDTVGRHYGAAARAVDFASDPDAVAAEINRFVADVTNDKITNLVPAGTLQRDDVMTLVNALYLKASWQQVFAAKDTESRPFKRLDGREVEVPMMSGGSGSSAKGDGWVGATKSYVGNLAVQFILPDEGRFADVAGRLDEAFAEYARTASGGAELKLPRFESRYKIELDEALRALGLTKVYEPGHLLGIAPDKRLVLRKALHETFVAVDEEGTEAAAATALVFQAVSGPVTPPVPVVLDRPFLFRIIDRETDTTLFLGRVMDPTVGGD
jgi:serpin B